MELTTQYSSTTTAKKSMRRLQVDKTLPLRSTCNEERETKNLPLHHPGSPPNWWHYLKPLAYRPLRRGTVTQHDSHF